MKNWTIASGKAQNNHLDDRLTHEMSVLYNFPTAMNQLFSVELVKPKDLTYSPTNFISF